jgi:hypothetical protein
VGDNVQYMDAAVLCRSCSWFGVYRQDVTERIKGCPACGAPNLAVLDVGDERWQKLGRRLLETPSDEEQRPSAKH